MSEKKLSDFTEKDLAMLLLKILVGASIGFGLLAFISLVLL